MGVAAWIREAEATRRAAQARLAELTRQWSAPTADDLRAVIKRLNGVPGLLARATPERRRRLYTALGVDLRYDHRTRTVGARQDASRWWGYQRVGGGLELQNRPCCRVLCSLYLCRSANVFWAHSCRPVIRCTA